MVEWAKVATQGKQQRLADAQKREHEASEAKAKRDAEAAEAKAQRELDAAQKLREERRAMVDQWRAALGEASTEYKTRMHEREINKGSSVSARRNVQIPDIVGTQWFETLRPHLDDENLRTAATLHCNTEVTVALATEIAGIETVWLRS